MGRGARGVSGPVDALGYSMGVTALLASASIAPDRVGRLVTVGTGRGGRTYPSAPGALWNRHHRALPAVARPRHRPPGARPPRERAGAQHLVDRHSFVDRAYCRPAAVRLRDWVRPRQVRADRHRIARALDHGPRLGELAAPTLVACGRYDPQLPLACSEELAEGIHDARLEVFDASVHDLFIEEADVPARRRRPPQR